MKLPRRKFLHLGAGAAGFPALPRFALAQVYPARPVHIVVGFQGGTAERRHRALCRRMAVRAAWSTIRGREPSRCCGERRGRSRRAGRTRWLHAAPSRSGALHRRFTKISISVLRVTSRQSRASSAPRSLWKSVRPSHPRQFPISSPTPRPTRARLPWPRPASEPFNISPASCFR